MAGVQGGNRKSVRACVTDDRPHVAGVAPSDLFPPLPLPSSSPHPRFPERHHPPAPTPPRPPSPPPTLLHASRATSCLAGPEEFVFTCVFVCTRRELRRPLLKCGATCRNISAGASHALLTAWHDEILPPSTTTLPGLLLCSVLHLKKKKTTERKAGEGERRRDSTRGDYKSGKTKVLVLGWREDTVRGTTFEIA